MISPAEVRALIERILRTENWRMNETLILKIETADALAALLARVETLETVHGHMRQNAGIEHQESNTQRGIVLGILRALGLPLRDGDAETLVRAHVATVRAERDRLRAAIKGLCKTHCVHFRPYNRHAPECLAYELTPDDDNLRQREPQTEADRL